MQTGASSKSRSAVSRRRSFARAGSGVVVSPGAFSKRRTARTAARPGSPVPRGQTASVGASSRTSPRMRTRPSPIATSVGLELEAEDGRDDDGLRAALGHDGLELRVGVLDAVGVQHEVRALGEDPAEERAQGELRPLAGRHGDAAVGDVGVEVGVEPAALRERVDGREVGGELRDDAAARVDEVRRERAVAVERAARALLAGAPALGRRRLDDLEPELVPVLDVGGQLPGRLLGEGGQRGVEVAVAHAPRFGPRRPGPARAAPLARDHGPVRRLLPTLAVLALAGCGSARDTAETPERADAGRRAPDRPPRAPSATELPPQDLRPVPIGRSPRFRPAAVVRRGAPVAGLRCDPGRARRFGVHLELFAAGRVVVVPAGIGIAPPRRREGAYVRGGRCRYALATTEPTGVVEVVHGTRATLGDLFALWGAELGPRRLVGFEGRVRAWVGGRRIAGDPRAIRLTHHAQVVLAVGPEVPVHSAFAFRPGL